MTPWPLEKIQQTLHAKSLTHGLRQFNGQISTDSRKAQPNDLFIAIEGQNHDAHTFLPDVIKRQVSLILVHKKIPPETLQLAQQNEVTLLQVANTITALNQLAAAYRNELTTRVITISGSNGKTTTKRILHTLLAEKFSVHASPKSFNNNIGMPLTLLETESTHDFVILEIGTNAPGEIAALAQVARPDIALITNIGLEHLEKLTDLQGVANEEAALAPHLTKNAPLILPHDAPELHTALTSYKNPRITVALAPPSSLTTPSPPSALSTQHSALPSLLLTNLTESLTGLTFSINNEGEFHLPLLGQHNAFNALMAIAIARHLALTDAQITTALKKVKTAPMRLEITHLDSPHGRHLVINDAYNANPTSMQAALQTFSELGPTESVQFRRIAILADMLELGPTSVQLHQQIGQLLATLPIQIFLAIGPHMQSAADAAKKSNPSLQIHHVPTTLAAAQLLPTLLRPNDILLLKGSRGMALEALLQPTPNPHPPVQSHPSSLKDLLNPLPLTPNP